MHQVQLELTDQVYSRAKRRAAQAGFKSVGEYAAEVFADDLVEPAENFDHLFSAERLALIDKAEAQIEAGQCMTAEEADVELARRRTA